MLLQSTKDKNITSNFQEAVFRGLPPDNGLYVPVNIPELPSEFFNKIREKSFQEIAFEVAKALIDEISEEELWSIVEEAINFDAPVVKVYDNIHTLELFHGPTLAFKDFGARFMSRVMSYFLKHKQQGPVTILVATSGDTGSAVAQGFLGVENVQVVLLYPKGKISKIQEQQLTTNGQNITALEVDGNFDDCRKLVKQAFLDQELNEEFTLSSANSINISRLIPQSFYYFYAYAQLQADEPPVFCVPSGNFGNLCGGLIAHAMGLPVSKFIAATNINDVVPEYLQSGIFTPRASKRTISNAMDVGNPSNFVRMLHLFKADHHLVTTHVVGKSYDDIETKNAIRQVYNEHGYILDPHGAVGYLALVDYLSTNSEKPGIFLETAHPAKFVEVVEQAINAKIELPSQLKEALEKKKQAVEMSNNYDDFKNYLLDKTLVK